MNDPRLAAFLIATAALAVFMLMAIRRTTTPARAEFLYGVLAGVLLGTGYLHTKILALAVQGQHGWLAIVAGVSMALGLGIGLFVLQLGFWRGRALIVTAVNLVTNQVLVVAGGLICLGERFPREPVAFTAPSRVSPGFLTGILLLARLSATAGSRVQAAEAISL